MLIYARSAFILVYWTVPVHRIASHRMEWNEWKQQTHSLVSSLALYSALYFAVLCCVVPCQGFSIPFPYSVSWDACRYIIHWNFHLYIRRPRIHSIVCVGVGVCVRLLSYTHMHCMRSFIQLGKLNVTAHYLVPPIVVCFFVMFHFPVQRHRILFLYTVARMPNSITVMCTFSLSILWNF